MKHIFIHFFKITIFTGKFKNISNNHLPNVHWIICKYTKTFHHSYYYGRKNCLSRFPLAHYLFSSISFLFLPSLFSTKCKIRGGKKIPEEKEEGDKGAGRGSRGGGGRGRRPPSPLRLPAPPIAFSFHLSSSCYCFHGIKFGKKKYNIIQTF